MLPNYSKNVIRELILFCLIINIFARFIFLSVSLPSPIINVDGGFYMS